MKKLIGVIIIIASIVGGVYLGGWILLVKPLLAACAAFDAGILTRTLVITTIIKCIIASTVETIIVYVGVIIGSFIALD